MGPGFDCLGIALDIWNVITVEVGVEGFHISGQGAAELPRDRSNMVWQSIARVFQEVGHPMPTMSLTCRNDIPTARGLGSSSAALLVNQGKHVSIEFGLFCVVHRLVVPARTTI